MYNPLIVSFPLRNS